MNVGFFSEIYHPDVNATVTTIATFEDEAAAAGLPLVARRDPPLEQVLQHGGNGLFVEDEGSLGDALSLLLSTPEVAHAYGEASARIARRHDVHHHTRELLEVYERARGNGTRPRSPRATRDGGPGAVHEGARPGAG